MYCLDETLPSTLTGMEQATTTRPSKNAFIKEKFKNMLSEEYLESSIITTDFMKESYITENVLPLKTSHFLSCSPELRYVHTF